MKNELKEIIQEKCRKFVKYNSFDFNEFENNVLEIFEKIKENEYYDREYKYEIKNFIDKTLIHEYGRYMNCYKLVLNKTGKRANRLFKRLKKYHVYNDKAIDAIMSRPVFRIK